MNEPQVQAELEESENNERLWSQTCSHPHQKVMFTFNNKHKYTTIKVADRTILEK